MALDAGNQDYTTSFRDDFELQIGSARQGALLVTSLLLLCRLLGFCALTWATVVLLGGFASVLRLLDFYLITFLLLLEIFRLFIIQTLSKLLTHALLSPHRLPIRFSQHLINPTDAQPCRASRLNLLGQTLLITCAIASFASTLVRFVLSVNHTSLSEKSPPADGHSNLPSALFTFYIVILLNAAFAMASALLRPYLRERCHTREPLSFIDFYWRSSWSAQSSLGSQDSLKCYHDEVFKTAMEVGPADADLLSFLDFAFTKLEWDYKRNIRRPTTVMELNKDLIRYLYLNEQGIGMACQYMKAGDVWQQQLGAVLLGFWSNAPEIESKVDLFWALRERMYGTGKVAEAALNSIEVIGKRLGNACLINDPTVGTNVVDTLVQLLLLDPIQPTMLLFQIRAFEACCHHPDVLRRLYELSGVPAQADSGMVVDSKDHAAISGSLQRHLTEGTATYPSSKLQMLCIKLHRLIDESKTRAEDEVNNLHLNDTIKIYAGNALHNLLCYGRPEFLRQETKAFLARMVDQCIDPAQLKNRTLSDEISEMPIVCLWAKDVVEFEKWRMLLGLSAYADGWNRISIIVDHEGGDKTYEPGTADHKQLVQRLLMEARGPGL